MASVTIEVHLDEFDDAEIFAEANRRRARGKGDGGEDWPDAFLWRWRRGEQDEALLILGRAIGEDLLHRRAA
jgi:hypothetical protein